MAKRECLLGRGELSDADRKELEQFEDFLWEVNSGKSQDAAYRGVYGEVVYPRAPASSGAGK
jgi:hypothetical protein